MSYTPTRLPALPGIRRDGTVLDGQQYSDGEWVRFQRGRPKKMGGYRTILSSFTGPIRGTHVYSKQMLNIIHSFSSSKIEAVLVDGNGLGAAIYDRTPVGFVPQTDYIWQEDTFFNQAGSNVTVLLAHPGRNLSSIDNNIATPVYYGDVSTAAPLTSIGQSVDGGVVSLQPYLVLYGSNGLVMNSNLNSVTDFTNGDANTANVCSSKIVKGLPTRGAGQSPSALLWSLEDVIRMSFIGPPNIFRFDNLSSQSSILSSSSVIEYDGLFFWIGVDRFLMFNGAIREVPNQMNTNWFFDHLNFDNRQKVWALKVPRYGEIWWFYPRDGATECTHAVIYNVRENIWYDAESPRSSGYFSQVFRFPIMSDSRAESSGSYSIWQHEFGVDQIKGDVQIAIPSSFTTNDMGLPTGGAAGEAATGADRWTRVDRIEPDFVQQGPMTVSVLTKEYANSPEVVAATKEFTSDTEKVDLRCQGRHFKLKFENNSQGGNYECGSVLIDLTVGDARQ